MTNRFGEQEAKISTIGRASPDIRRRNGELCHIGSLDHAGAAFANMQAVRLSLPVEQGKRLGWQALARPLDDDQVRQAQYGVRPMPAGKACEGVSPEKEQQGGVWILRLQPRQRIDGESRLVASRLARIHPQAGHALDRELEHVDPFGGACTGRTPVRRTVRREQPQLLEPILLGKFQSDPQVSEVHGIECATEQSDAFAHVATGGQTTSPRVV